MRIFFLEKCILEKALELQIIVKMENTGFKRELDYFGPKTKQNFTTTITDENQNPELKNVETEKGNLLF